MTSKNRIITYISIALIAFILGLLSRCSPKKDQSAGETKTTTRIEYRTVIKKDTFKDIKTEISTQYKYITKDSIQYVPTATSSDIIMNFIPSKYAYTYNKSFYSEGNAVRNDVSIKGWGRIEEISSNFTIHDTLRDTFSTTTITKERPSTGTYLSAGYSTLRQPTLGLDIVRNRALIGAYTSYDPETNKLQTGVRIGIKL